MPDGRTFYGHRHHHCIAALRDTGETSHDFEQGFITNHMRFVDRQEGFRIQTAAGIKSRLEGTVNASAAYRNGKLYSEDLY